MDFKCESAEFNGPICKVQCARCKSPNRIEAAALLWWRQLPPMQVTLQELKKLPEYSTTNPTGVIPGKRWRRHNGAFDSGFKAAGGIPRWVICRYEEAPDESRNVLSPDGEGYVKKRIQMCKIVSYRPAIRVAAPTKEYV
jgi:hypothetical protein